MMKKIITIVVPLVISFNLYACPDLVGKYNKCKSEVNPKMRGQYIIDQHQESNFEVYTVQFVDDETGEAKTDTIPTNGSVVSRKERVPKIGVNVRVEAKSTCDATAVVTDSQIYFMGAHSGHFTTKIYKTGTTLHSDIDGSYLSRDIHKRITCELQ
jgi:hypothetical protein